MNLKVQRRVKKKGFTREGVPMLAPTAINQMWALDFMDDTLYDGSKFRLLNVMDEANREGPPAANLLRFVNTEKSICKLST